MQWDVAVVGAGPAGWTAAVNFAGIGFSTVLVAPDPFEPWPNRYGVWCDEVAECETFAERSWPRAEVRLDADRAHVLNRAYARIDNQRLQAKLRGAGEGVGLQIRRASVVGVEHESAGSTLTLDTGDPLAAVLIIDATGHRPRLIKAGQGRPGGVQVAYGVRARLEQGRVEHHDRIVLMDFSADHLPADDRDPPTFLYAMPLGGSEVFVEETSLVGRPPIALETCRQRLDLRMRARGWQLGPADEVEHCFIPMGGPQPPRQQRVVAFGGAAALVHPATGYMLANVLRTGPRLARAVHAVRDRREAALWSKAAWSAVWPDDRIRAWALYRYGMEVLINMGVSSIARFFDTFFKIRPSYWQAYLSGDVPSREVAAAMWALFMAASPQLRWQLVSKGFYALMRPISP